MKIAKWGVVIATLAGSTLAQAAPVFYTSEVTFLSAAAGFPLTLEDFESYDGPPTQSITGLASGLNISSNLDLFDYNSNVVCAGTSSCVGFLAPSSGGTQTFTFDGGNINAFGIFLGDLGTTGGDTTLTFTTSGGAAQSYTLTGAGDNERYFGIVDTAAAFASVTMSTTADGDFVAIDNVRWSGGKSVPEPGSLALVSLCLAALAAVRRRRT